MFLCVLCCAWQLEAAKRLAAKLASAKASEAAAKAAEASAKASEASAKASEAAAKAAEASATARANALARSNELLIDAVCMMVLHVLYQYDILISYF